MSTKLFKQQINLLRFVGKFVSLDQVRKFDDLAKINFCLTFDDGSKTILSIKHFLKKHQIPYVLAPCVDISDNGKGLRDKVYFIEKHLLPDEIFAWVSDAIGQQYPIDQDNFSFYSFTKSPHVDPMLIKDNVINPLFEKIPLALREKHERPYLSWEEIRQEFLHNPLVTIANHSYQHANMAALSQQLIKEDVEKSFEAFQNNLQIVPEYYSVPFGGITQNLLYDLNKYLRNYGCKGVLWVNNHANLIRSPFEQQIMHLNRVHTDFSTLWAWLRFCLNTISARELNKESLKK